MNRNELGAATSPYLRQHAHNPVHWRQWSDDAFAEARERDVPVLLSVGYATCYWCHVMERESFESDQTARVMNDNFVCIKLDREQHPEIDEIYMAAATISTGAGGWPMNVFLEPDQRRPFWCGTYFPPQPTHGRPAWTQILTALADAWRDKRDNVLEQARRLGDAVREQIENPATPVEVGADQVGAAVSSLLARFDDQDGGFGGAPKFPQPVFLEFLLDARDAVDQQSSTAIDHVARRTLDAMALGGIHDQIGGGFHRYSVDGHWTVPHFEKMLYDNAQLLRLYARAAVLYDDPFYARVARRTARYALREMTPQGAEPGAAGFHSAQDAEVDGREGLNYLWTPDQMRDALDPDDAAFAIALYALDAEPNFRDPHHPDAPPAHIPRLSQRPSPEDLERLDAINDTLRAARDQRPQPITDDKVLCSWNAMMVSALTTAASALREPDFMDAARRATAFLESNRTPSGALARTAAQNPESRVPAGLDDHAALAAALADLAALADFQDSAGDDTRERLGAILSEIDASFTSAPGVYHDTRADRSDLFVRPRTLHDGATPSAIGTLTLALARRAASDDPGPWIDRACDAVRAASASIADNPLGCTNATRALLALMRVPDRIEGRLAIAPPSERGDDGAPAGPIALYVSDDAVELSESSPAASITVALDIPEPYHIIAADPGDTDAARALTPLRVGLVSGSGVAVYADYPKGEPSGVEGVGRVNTLSGRIEFEVALEHAPGIGATPGDPVLGISYQACTDDRCTAPRTLRLGVEVTRGD